MFIHWPIFLPCLLTAETGISCAEQLRRAGACRSFAPSGQQVGSGHTAERGLDADLVSANLLDRFEGVVDVIGGGLLRRLGVAATDGVSNG
jgi:hypothetical protein